MDDDLAFGASVWGATTEFSLPPPITQTTSQSSVRSTEDGFDEFEDFGTPAETIAASGDEADDDFGDFGDFGEAVQMGEASSFEEAAFGEEVRIPTESADWEPLSLDPMPSKQELAQRVEEILGPLWANDDLSQLTDEPIREAEGLNQTLVTPESRQLYNLLLPATRPILKPVNWTRSRIRRQQLITLGIPVNLDEVLPRGNLPALEIRTRPTSAPPGPQTAPIPRALPSAMGSHTRAGTPRSGTPQPNGGKSSVLAAAQLRLGPRPAVDESKVSALLDLNPDNLSLMPLPTLQSHLAAMKEQTVNMSALLTHLLQTKDALQQDSETYNKLIGELVGEAQKIKTGKRTAGSRRGSAMS